MKISIQPQLDVTNPAAPTAPACPAVGRRRRAVRLALPLLSFVLPTVVIGYGFVIPRSCIAGWNQLSVGFATTVLGACLAYVGGLRAARAI
jgi:hypothetical protein